MARLLIILAPFLVFSAAATAQPLSTEFTYQGELRNGASLATGLHDFRFRLYDSLAGGTPQGQVLCADNVSVTNGRFSILLDFGAQFAGQKRFLEIQTRADTGLDCSNVGGFVLLFPRQELTAAPNAAFALAAASSTNATQLGGQPPSHYTSAANLTGALPGVSLSGSYPAAVNITNPANTFAGSGAGLINLNAAAISSGTLADARLSGNIPRLNAANIFSNSTNAFMGALGIGTASPTHTLHIANPLPTIAIHDTDSTSQQVGYISYRDSANAERAWVGFGTAGSPDFSLVNARPGGNINLLPLAGKVTIGTTEVVGQRLLTVDSGTNNCAHFQSISDITSTLQAINLASSGGALAISATSNGTGGIGLFGAALSGTGGVYAVFGNTTSANPSANALYAQGRLTATGTKSFRIDHPADPANKYLFHYCAESDEVINFYSGKATLNENGEAVVELPSYFAAINRDPRYTLTALGAPMPLLHIATEIDDGALSAAAAARPGAAIPRCRFSISGGVPGGKVSWRIDAVRNDEWMKRCAAPVEADKPGTEIGTFQHPEFYGQSPAKGLAHSFASPSPKSNP